MAIPTPVNANSADIPDDLLRLINLLTKSRYVEPLSFEGDVDISLNFTNGQMRVTSIYISRGNSETITTRKKESGSYKLDDALDAMSAAGIKTDG